MPRKSTPMDEQKLLKESAKLPMARTRNGAPFRDNHGSPKNNDAPSVARSVDPPEQNYQPKSPSPSIDAPPTNIFELNTNRGFMDSSVMSSPSVKSYPERHNSRPKEISYNKPSMRGGSYQGPSFKIYPKNNLFGLDVGGPNKTAVDDDERDGASQSHDGSFHSLEMRLQDTIDKVDRMEQGIAEIKQLLMQGNRDKSDLSVISEEMYKPTPIEVLPKELTYQGREMMTCPILLEVGTKLFWRYSGDLLKTVGILEVTKPGVRRQNPIYHVRVTGGGSTADVRHDELFIPKDQAVKIAPRGVIDATRTVLSASSQLDLLSLDNAATPEMIKLWESLTTDNFKLTNFKAAIDGATLEDDSLIALKQLNNLISLGLTAASKTTMIYLPDLNQLSPSTSIRDIMLPPPQYPHIYKAKAVYDVIAQAVAAMLADKDFAKNAPKARRIIKSMRNGSKDGIDQLYSLYTKRFPFLGAIDFDAYETIKQTIAKDRESLDEFIVRVQETQMQLELSNAEVPSNAMLKQLLEQLAGTNIYPLIAEKHHEFIQWTKKHPGSALYPTESVDSIIEYLEEGKPPEIIRLTNPGVIEPVTDQPTDYTSAVHRHKKHSSFSKPTYMSMTANSTATDETEEDDSSIAELSVSAEDKARVEEMIQPMFAALKMEDNDQENEKLWDDLFYKALRQVKQKQCEACLGHHDTDECRARGLAFLDPVLRKRVEQVNAKYGDTPKNPPKPSIPPKANFSPKLQQKAMTVKFEAKAPTIHYRTMQTDSEVESTLDEITQELEQSLDLNNSVNNPQLAVLHLKSQQTNDSTNESNGRDIADAMQVADYSVYNEQVNC